MKKYWLLSIPLVLACIVFFQTRPLGATLPVAGQTYTLAGSGVTASNTSSITLSSLTIPQTGYELQDSDFSPTFYITFEPGSTKRQEIASCTTVVQNANNTATLSGCSRGLLPFSPFTASTTYAFSHAGGTSVIFSDPPQLFNEYTAKANDESITGLYTFSQLPLGPTSTPTNQQQFITLYQFQQATTTGGVNGSETAKGVFEGATQAEMGLSTEFGSTGATLALLSKYATSTRNGTGQYVIVTAGSGYVSSTFGGVAFSMATLNSSALVVQNPASASITAGTSTIPITSSITSTLSGSYFGTTTPGAVPYVGSDGFSKAITMTTSGYSLRINSSMTAPTWYDGGMGLGASNEGTLFSYPISHASGSWSLTDATFDDLGGYANIESSGATWNAIASLIGVGTGSALDWGDNKSITVEFMARATNGTAGSRRMGLGAGEFDTVSSSAGAAVALFSISSSSLFATASPGNSTITNTAITGVTVTNWNLYKIVWTPSTNVKFYVNGVLRATISTTLPTTGTSNFGIGGTNNGEDLLLGQVVVTQGL